MTWCQAAGTVSAPEAERLLRRAWVSSAASSPPSAPPGCRWRRRSAAAQGDWLIRVRAINVDPDSSSGEVSANGTAIAGSGVTVDDDTQPELDITYMLADNWGLELVLASSKHGAFADGSIAALGQLLDTRTLPPSLLLQYHFAPDGKVRPYVGLGVNLTLFFSEEVTSSFEAAAGGSSSAKLGSSFGLAGQLGLDIALKGDWFLNFDVKYVDMSHRRHDHDPRTPRDAAGRRRHRPDDLGIRVRQAILSPLPQTGDRTWPLFSPTSVHPAEDTPRSTPHNHGCSKTTHRGGCIEVVACYLRRVLGTPPLRPGVATSGGKSAATSRPDPAMSSRPAIAAKSEGDFVSPDPSPARRRTSTRNGSGPGTKPSPAASASTAGASSTRPGARTTAPSAAGDAAASTSCSTARG